MTAYYLAARFSRHDEMRGVRDVLQGVGHTVTSRWIDLHGGDQLESAAAEQLNTDPDSVADFGLHDLEDIAAADVVVSFTSADGGGKGGRHVEFGYALGIGKHVVIVGPRENIFHTHPDVEWYPTWWAFAASLWTGSEATA